jgi:osmotically inducible lipoprotein OsmB
MLRFPLHKYLAGTRAAAQRSNLISLSLEDMMVQRTCISIIGAMVMASTLAACGTPTRQQVGVGTGAVVGGVLGNVVTDGSTLGTVGGAAVGGVIGNEVTKPRK